ncbi:MAG: MFS transporter [Burkholderiales bacterium]
MQTQNKKHLPRTVIVVGFISFFNDLASEMVTPLIPIVLATVLGAGPVVLGVIEGVADSVSAFIKLWSGRHSDSLGGRRKWLTFYGYLLSNIVRPLFGLATSWGMLVGLRSVDRIGKGIRTAPRDALVSDATPPEIRGYAYGFHRAMDNGGAMGGALIAAAVLTWTQFSLQQIILWSVVPGVAVLLLAAFGIKEPVKALPVRERAELPPLLFSLLSNPMRRYLAVLALFTFARASETFIVLRGHELGKSVVELLLLWAALSVAKSITSLYGGKLADKLGMERLVLTGWTCHSLSFALLACVSLGLNLWLAAIVYGLLAGLAEGGERGLISEFAVANQRGTAFGWYNMTLGIASIPAGIIFGAVWEYFGAGTAFAAASVIALCAALTLHFWVWRKAEAESIQV